jgi:DMSO/TMAO reductase YedYZ heme-binding membrane subunit
MTFLGSNGGSVQVIAALLIFVAAYLAVLLCAVFILVMAEGLWEGYKLVRAYLVKSAYFARFLHTRAYGLRDKGSHDYHYVAGSRVQ